MLYRTITILIASCVCAVQVLAQALPQTQLTTPFERDTLSSASYGEAIDWYEVLAKAYPERCHLATWGDTDAGLPLRPLIIGTMAARRAMLTGQPPTFFINNGIHAGEPCGVDASMLVARDLVTDAIAFAKLDTTSLVVIIPAYNVGGMLNRGGGTRANQNGPKAYGFRGNARNFDLNRDFTKQDSRNARALTSLLRGLQPDVFVDTHTTNGADYQYELTVIATQPEKLGPVLGPYLRDSLLPALYHGVAAAGHPVSPYVYSEGVPQESGIMPFIESPRYSSGYAALLGSLSFITEAHMLKPFDKRVRATEAFLNTALGFWLDRRPEIAAARDANKQALFAADSMVLRWEVDTSRFETLQFQGYAPVRELSTVTGTERLRYDRNAPQTVATRYYAFAKPALAVPTPRAYVLPKAYRHLLPMLTADLAAETGQSFDYHHGLDVRVLDTDTMLVTQAYHIDDYATATQPYEGHYLHYNVDASLGAPTETLVSAGDILIELTPTNARLVTALLEPQAPDSYFAWGAFDAYLQRKEHYSDYVFEDTAAQMLDADAELRAEFDALKVSDAEFGQDARAQLDWLYQRSGMAEQSYLRYPVLRVGR